MVDEEVFDQTVGAIARNSESSEKLIRRYADAGLINSRRDSSGRRLFAKGTAEQVRAIKAERIRAPKGAAAA